MIASSCFVWISFLVYRSVTDKYTVTSGMPARLGACRHCALPSSQRERCVRLARLFWGAQTPLPATVCVRRGSPSASALLQPWAPGLPCKHHHSASWEHTWHRLHRCPQAPPMRRAASLVPRTWTNTTSAWCHLLSTLDVEADEC